MGLEYYYVVSTHKYHNYLYYISQSQSVYKEHYNSVLKKWEQGTRIFQILSKLRGDILQLRQKMIPVYYLVNLWTITGNYRIIN